MDNENCSIDYLPGMNSDENILALRESHPDGLHFVVGDTHGEAKTLKSLMRKLYFDPCKDHIYFVGDYNAGGSPSALLSYMSQYYQEDYEYPGFHMIRGNHERELYPQYPLENLPDIIVIKRNCLTFFLVHAGMVSSAFQAIIDDMAKYPNQTIFAYRLDEYCAAYDAPLRQITWSRRGLYSQKSRSHQWPSEPELHANHACIIHGHSPYCFFINSYLGYGDINYYWEKHHVWFSEDLCSFNIDSNIKGRFVNGEAYRGLSCLCLESIEKTASQNGGILTVEAVSSPNNIVFSEPYIPCWNYDPEGNITTILAARPQMKTITIDPSGLPWIVE